MSFAAIMLYPTVLDLPRPPFFSCFFPIEFFSKIEGSQGNRALTSTLEKLDNDFPCLEKASTHSFFYAFYALHIPIIYNAFRKQ